MRLVVVLLVSMMIVAIDARSAEPAEFVSTQCGISFLHPSDWRVTQADKNQCTFSISAVKPKQPDSELSVEISTDGFAAAAVKVGFEYRRDAWVIKDGAFMWEETRPVIHPLLCGIVSTPTQRCYGEDGYRGMCDTFVAVASNLDDRVVAMSGGPGAFDAFDLVLESFRFDLDFTFEYADRETFRDALEAVGASRAIRGWKAPREELWARMLREIRQGADAVETAATLVKGADQESREEIVRALQDAFANGSRWVLPHVGREFTFAEICRPPADLHATERAAWIAKVEKNLASHETFDLPADVIEKCRADIARP